MQEATIKKALTLENVLATKYEVYPFSGVWEEFLNQPENRGVWFVWGNSGSGKSSFIMALAKQFSQFEKVMYNALEEYQTKSYKDRCIRFKMAEVKRNFQTVKYSLEELKVVLKRRNSAQVVIIDSEKYMKWKWDDYLALKEMFPTKTFIIVGHAKGTKASTQLSTDIMYDAYIKIWVEGYTAFSKGREIGSNGGIFTIWEEGAEKYHGVKPQNKIA